jgi:hypothetical protein
MKKVQLAVWCILISASVVAQKKSGVILKGGVNFANISISKGGNVDEAKTLTSFHVGLAGDIPIATNFSFQPGLLLTGKGSKIQDGNESDNNYYKSTTNPIYLELPLNFVGRIPIAENTGLLLGAGPYLAMGIAGKNKVEGRVAGVSFSSENSIDFSNDDPTTPNYEEDAGIGKMKRFDVGANFLAGFNFGKIDITAGYGLGFLKINSGANSNTDDNNKHRVWSVSLGLHL